MFKRFIASKPDAMPPTVRANIVSKKNLTSPWSQPQSCSSTDTANESDHNATYKKYTLQALIPPVPLPYTFISKTTGMRIYRRRNFAKINAIKNKKLLKQPTAEEQAQKECDKFYKNHCKIKSHKNT